MKITTSSVQSLAPRRAWLMRAAAALIAAGAALTAMPQKAHAGVFIGVGISVGFPPPVLPVYVQPVIPAVGYIWTPGYWAWNGAGYYWVPGTWVLPPYYGALWTPGYWGWVGGVYTFHAGYWGPHVGFYGGVNYGYGYGGSGYVGGHWGAGGFYYNRSVNQFGGVHVTNVYNQTVINNTYVSRTSYNGGQGGLTARETPQEAAFARDPHVVGPIAAQQQHMEMASHNQAMLASVNHGNPSIAATSHAGVFTGAGVSAARGAAFSPAAAHMNAAAVHAPAAGNPALRSASFAPHANTANVAHAGANTYHPATVNHASYAAHSAPAGAYHASPANAYHPTSASAYHPTAASHAAPANAYHAAPAAAYHPSAAPQYHAQTQARPAQAPRGGGGGAPHGGGGGGHDSHHG
jgi:hypothetical protein